MPRARRHASSLPAQPNALIGRERELSDLLELLGSRGVRLVTVTGAAGTGKTRLAVAAASQFTASGQDPVWFVDLAPIHDPRQVLGAIGRATGVREQRGELVQARLERHIGQRRVLLVLDNFEQVLPAATGVADLLAACPNLRLLATSRAPLRLRWEHVYRVTPLAVPPLRPLPEPEELARVPSVALFCERARAIDAGFLLTKANAVAVAQICSQLDGLPLAIELAAARSDVYPPVEVLARLRRNFELLSGGAADLPARQRSLLAAFDWGYELLSAAEQSTFRRLGVFVGGFTPAGALAVAGSDDLATLVQHSLVRRDPSVAGEDAGARFRMLETVRAYAVERARQSGELEAALERHAQFMLQLAEAAAPELLGRGQAEWLAQLEAEHDNLMAALRWAIDTRQTELSLRLVRALWRFWWLHGHLSEGMDALDAVLSGTDTSSAVHAELTAGVLNGAGVLAHVRGEYGRAERLLVQSLELAGSLELKSAMAAAHHNLAALARERGDWPRARAAYEQSLALERELGNTWGIATSLINLGALAEDQSDTARAAELLDESLGLLRRIGDEHGIATALHNLAAVARDAGDWSRAAELHEQSLALWRKLGDRWGIAAELCDLGRVTERAGDWQRAARLIGESLTIFGELGVRQPIAGCLEGLAAVLCAARRPSDAATLLGAAEALREDISSPLPARERQDVTHTLKQVRVALGGRAFASAVAAGRALSVEAATREGIRLARAPDVVAPSRSVDVLSARERQVVKLVAEGLSNRQIAEQLVISERTADRHVSNILGKLGMNTRTQVAAWSTERHHALSG